jgi:hypothetical protein
VPYLGNLSSTAASILAGVAAWPQHDNSTSATSPGIVICDWNSEDFQHFDDGQREIATLGDGGLVHFAWTHRDVIDPSPLFDLSRYVNYNGYSTATGLSLGSCGVTISGGGKAMRAPWWGYGGYPSITVGPDDNAHPAFQQWLPDCYSRPNCSPGTWIFDQGIPGFALFSENVLARSFETAAIYPHIASDLTGSATSAKVAPGDDVFHVVSRASGDTIPFTNEMFYWRRIGANGTWEGPAILDGELGYNHHVATDPTTEKLAVIYLRDDLDPNGLQQVVYMQSPSNGADWIGAGVPAYPTPLTDLGFAPVQVTAYGDPVGPQSWLECTGEYDLDGMLHVVWVEQAVAGGGPDCRIRHWDNLSMATRTVVEALGFLNIGDQGVRDLWLAYPQIAFGDGSTLCTDGPANPGSGGSTSNRDYMYLSYEQYGGPTPSQAGDAAANGYQNLDIYLTVSNDRGLTWAQPSNLTNTQSPGCNGTQTGNKCASERNPSIAMVVNDTIHLMYFLDTDAGDAVFGQGSWTFGQVMYYRIPGGTDADYLCPQIAPRLSAALSAGDLECGYIARISPPETVNEALTIGNLGNGPLSGSVSVSPPTATWLQTATGGFAIGPGQADDVRSVVMDAGDISIAGPGLYQAQIEITHDDPSIPNPRVIPVDFLVHELDAPVAAFDGAYTPALPPVTVTFSSASSVGAEGYYWDFGDGDTSAEANPIHTYTQSGLFDVQLRVSQDLGVCVRSDSLTEIDYVHVLACSCPYQADFDGDSFLTALDLGAMIDILFAGRPDIQDLTCPYTRADFDNDGFATAIDLARLIDHMFAGGNGPVDPCADR